MSKSAVRIANPVPGGMTYTSRPDHFIAAGLAYMDGGQLWFYESHQERKHQDPDVLYWNGACTRKGAMYLPGQVRC